MPKLPRLSGTEVVKRLARFGYMPVRQKGSHVVMRKENRALVVPMHRELDKGTLLNILRQAKIDKADFIL